MVGWGDLGQGEPGEGWDGGKLGGHQGHSGSRGPVTEDSEGEIIIVIFIRAKTSQIFEETLSLIYDQNILISLQSKASQLFDNYLSSKLLLLSIGMLLSVK